MILLIYLAPLTEKTQQFQAQHQERLTQEDSG
jgi:hypothetical protein